MTARLAIPALLFTTLMVGGCASRPAPAPAPPPSPGVRGPGVGVELAWWVVDDNPFDDRLATGEVARTVGADTRPIADVLAPYLNRAVPVSRESRERWKACGLRLVCIPRADIDQVRERLRISGPIRQQWVGEAPRWIEAMQGPQWQGVQPVSTDDGGVTLSSGSLRLLLRCWVGPALSSVPAAPGLTSGSIPGAVQIELMPQHVPPSDRGDIAALLKPKPALHDEGVLFPRLLLESSMSTDDVLLIVPEKPETEWKASTPEEEPASAEGTFSSLGPPLPTTPSLGEVMMTDVATGGRRNTRVVLVVQPMPPATFNLLAR
ncbi:MAG TPA: hypothetical protein VD997_15520 [Phycisphaerales bacterium]|nr:hypothetical protein [Phycisphaerales bacterium]